MAIIGVGATCNLCSQLIRAGETYTQLDGESVHHVCNLRRLGLDRSIVGGEILASLASKVEEGEGELEEAETANA